MGGVVPELQIIEVLHQRTKPVSNHVFLLATEPDVAAPPDLIGAIAKVVAQLEKRQLTLSLEDHVRVADALLGHQGRVHAPPEHRQTQLFVDALGEDLGLLGVGARPNRDADQVQLFTPDDAHEVLKLFLGGWIEGIGDPVLEVDLRDVMSGVAKSGGEDPHGVVLDIPGRDDSDPGAIKTRGAEERVEPMLHWRTPDSS